MRLRGPLLAVAILLPLQGCTFLEKAVDVATEAVAVGVPAAAGATLGPGWAFIGAVVGQFGYKIIDAEIDIEALRAENEALRQRAAGAETAAKTAGFFARWWRWILAACGLVSAWAWLSRSPVEAFRAPHPKQEQKVRAQVHADTGKILQAVAPRVESPPSNP